MADEGILDSITQAIMDRRAKAAESNKLSDALERNSPIPYGPTYKAPAQPQAPQYGPSNLPGAPPMQMGGGMPSMAGIPGLGAPGAPTGPPITGGMLAMPGAGAAPQMPQNPMMAGFPGMTQPTGFPGMTQAMPQQRGRRSPMMIPPLPDGY